MVHPLHFDTLVDSGIFGKKTPNARGFAREYLRSCMSYGLGQSVKRCLLVCTQKTIFCLGVWVFCEWRHKWKTFRPPWPTLPDPERQPLDGSISLKFLLGIRLQSKSFDTLDDLLRFRVQKLCFWLICYLINLFILDHNFWTFELEMLRSRKAQKNRTRA